MIGTIKHKKTLVFSVKSQIPKFSIVKHLDLILSLHSFSETESCPMALNIKCMLITF